MVLDFLAKDEGQGLVEYGLILVLIMVVVVAVITVFGGKVNTMFSSVNSGSLKYRQGFAPFGSPASLQAGTDPRCAAGPSAPPCVARSLPSERAVPTLRKYCGCYAREITRR